MKFMFILFLMFVMKFLKSPLVMCLCPDLGQVKDKAGCQISRMVVYIVRRRDFDDIKADQFA